MRGTKAFIFQWRDALLEAPELIASDRHVATLFMKYFDHDGRNGFPGTRRLVANAALAKGTVLSCLGWLTATGWLMVDTPGSGTKTTVYSAAIPTRRYSRAQRTVWAKERKQRLAGERASGCKPLPATVALVGVNGDALVGVNRAASGCKPRTPNTENTPQLSTETVRADSPPSNGNSLIPSSRPELELPETKSVLSEQTTCNSPHYPASSPVCLECGRLENEHIRTDLVRA